MHPLNETTAFNLLIGEVAEWSIAPVLKTDVLKGTGGSNPSLSAAKGVNQVVTRFTPFFTPKNQGWVYFFEFLRSMLAKKEEYASFSFRQHLF